MENATIRNIALQFKIEGELTSIKSYGNGHINDTYLIKAEANRYILQRINKNVFKKPLDVVNNIEKALDYLSSIGHNKLKTFASLKGEKYVLDHNEDHWRMYNFVEDTHTIDILENKKQAYEAAKAYGIFQRNMLNLNIKDFPETISDFHNLEKRYITFENLVKRDNRKRVGFASEAIKFALDHKQICTAVFKMISSGKLPLRITHNDTKINNVLLDNKTSEGVCVIDLDTIMPGVILYDYGDMVRTFTNPVAEDEKDNSKIILQTDIFEELTKGYLSVLDDVLTIIEKENLLKGAKYMILIIGLRFLSDYLDGDNYFKTKYEDHNLVRAKNQFALLTSLEKQEQKLQEIINQFK